MRHLLDGIGDVGNVLFTVLCAIWVIDSIWEWREYFREKHKHHRDHHHNDPID